MSLLVLIKAALAVVALGAGTLAAESRDSDAAIFLGSFSVTTGLWLGVDYLVAHLVWVAA